MTPKEAFKIGFFEKCAKDGLSPEQILQRIQHARVMIKMAGPVADAAGAVAGGGAAAAANTFKSLLPYMLIAPPIAGLAGGALLAKAQDDTYDKDEMKKREEIAEYNRAVARLQHLQERQQQLGPR